MSPDERSLPHIRLPRNPAPLDFKSPRKQFKTPPLRDREKHADALLDAFREIRQETENIQALKRTRNEPDVTELYLEFVGAPDHDAPGSGLVQKRAGIEVVSARQLPLRHEGDLPTKSVTIAVPPSQLHLFEEKIAQYRTKNTPTGKPQHQGLIAAIERVHLAALDSLWTDPDQPFPEGEGIRWWEVWLRANHSDRFHNYAAEHGLQVGADHLSFVDRVVVLVRAEPDFLLNAILDTAAVAELRAPRELAAFFESLPLEERALWSRDLRERLRVPPDDCPYICLLDLGVRREHPLLEPLLGVGDMFSCRADGSTVGIESHGTLMAGLAAYGNLTGALTSQSQIEVSHRLESVRMPLETDDSRRHLWGLLTEQGVYKPEIASPTRRRVHCLSLSASSQTNTGAPTSWSAALDALCFGEGTDRTRLMLVAAGTVNIDHPDDYRSMNELACVSDPAQAWNAISVGAFTELDAIDTASEPDFTQWKPLAPRGELSPHSSTSYGFRSNAAPGKPDFVMEGGNRAASPPRTEVDDPASLQLLTTSHRPGRVFDLMNGTCAATALAANYAARIIAEYPHIRPETVRALLIQSAEWTPAMLSRLNPKTDRATATRLVKSFGYGVPQLSRAIASARDRATLIIEDSLHPYLRGRHLTEWKLYELPWPTAELRAAAALRVRLRVTLSYYIEPNPANRGEVSRYSYASHGLRFDLIGTGETRDRFIKRNNKAARSASDGKVSAARDLTGWTFGGQRPRGSIQSDTWEGTAADLADRALLAVFPIDGWWRYHTLSSRGRRSAPYSLAMTIEAPGVDVYTSIHNQIAATTQVRVDAT